MHRETQKLLSIGSMAETKAGVSVQSDLHPLSQNKVKYNCGSLSMPCNPLLASKGQRPGVGDYVIPPPQHKRRIYFEPTVLFVWVTQQFKSHISQHVSGEKWGCNLVKTCVYLVHYIQSTTRNNLAHQKLRFQIYACTD